MHIRAAHHAASIVHKIGCYTAAVRGARRVTTSTNEFTMISAKREHHIILNHIVHMIRIHRARKAFMSEFNKQIIKSIGFTISEPINDIFIFSDPVDVAILVRSQ